MSAQPSRDNDMLQHALDYATRGIRVFPCAADKRPVTTHGLHDATTDASVIRQWWSQRPEALIGAAMGPGSGVFAIDPDKPKKPDAPDGVGAWKQLKAANGEHPETHTHVTPSGGLHVLFRWNPARPITNSKGSLPAGIDVRGEGGYVIMAPSRLPDGRAYELARHFDHGHFAEAPAWLLDLIEKKPQREEPPRASRENVTDFPGSHERYVAAAVDRECQNVAQAGAGGRNEALNKAAFALGTIVGAGHLEARYAADRLLDAARSSGLVQDDGHRAVMATIESGLTAGAAHPREMPERRSSARAERDTDRQSESTGAQEGQQDTKKASRSKKAPEPPQDGDTRPVIQLQAGVLARTVDEAEQALIEAECGFYQRGGLIVSAGTAPMVTAHRRRVMTPQIFEVGEHRILEEMMRVAAFEKWDARAKSFVPTNAPMTLPKVLKERKGKLNLPILSGLINAPTLRDDGTLIEIPGYDADTGLLFDPAGETFPAIKDRPTRQDAETAIATIGALIDSFPFVEDADRSVALAAILTATVRKSLSTAPAFAYSAPVAGSGKSKLVDITNVIATGKEAGVIALGSSPEEAEKRVSALLLAGCAVAIDNVEGAIGGDILCQLLTQTTVRGRILGKSDVPEMPTNVMVTITGNNLTLVGDMTRRSLLCRLDPKMERPELREFSFEPIERAKAARGALLVAALTVLRAYYIAGRPRQVSPLGSFEEWSDLVRSALLWLGCADPVKTMEQSRSEDPQLANLRMVMVQWEKVIGKATIGAGEAAQRASEKSGNFFEGGRSAFLHPEFRDALLAVANGNGYVDPRKLGTWLGRNKERVVEGMRFCAQPLKDGYAQWTLVNERKAKEQTDAYACRREAEAAHASPTRF